MAFTNKNLSVIAYANGFTMWHYIENSKLSDISKSGFFNPVKNLMNVGDLIIINAGDDTAMKKVVSTNSNVDIASV